MKETIKTLSIAAYWYLGCYIVTHFTEVAFQAGFIGMIAGLMTLKRVRDIEEAGGIVPVRLVYALYAPPPILAALGLILSGLQQQ